MSNKTPVNIMLEIIDGLLKKEEEYVIQNPGVKHALTTMKDVIKDIGLLDVEKIVILNAYIAAKADPNSQDMDPQLLAEAVQYYNNTFKK